MNKQLDMLNKMYSLLRKDKDTNEEAFETLITYVASKFVFKAPINVPWMKMDTLNALDQIFKLEVLQEIPWDWFGELDSKLKLGLLNKKLLLDQAAVAKQVGTLTLEGNPVAPHRILDDNTYTGRHIIEMWKKEKHAIYYGVESDLLAYRVALVNMRCYDIPSAIVYGNPLEQDFRAYSPNWRDANSWEPSKHRILPAETDERLRKVDGLIRII